MILSGQDPAAIARAVQTLAAGDLLGLPTETVYGLAADALRDEAVATPGWRGKIKVSGPGQNASMSFCANTGTSRANKGTCA